MVRSCTSQLTYLRGSVRMNPSDRSLVGKVVQIRGCWFICSYCLFFKPFGLAKFKNISSLLFTMSYEVANDDLAA